MKYVRTFNELKSSTYYSASKKLKDIGHVRRGGEIENWAQDVEKKEKDFKESENLKYYKNHDPFKIKIYKDIYKGRAFLMDGNFYLKPSLDYAWAQDSYQETAERFSLPFEISMMPADIESKEKAESIKNSNIDVYYDGVYWLQRLHYVLYDDNAYNPGEYFWESSDSHEFFFENRSEALRFKKLFADSVNGKNSFSDSKYSNLNNQIKRFFKGDWFVKWKTGEKIEDSIGVLSEENLKKFLDSTYRMSVNKLYIN